MFYHDGFDCFFGVSRHSLFDNYMILNYFYNLIRDKTWYNMIVYSLFLNHPIQGTWYGT